MDSLQKLCSTLEPLLRRVVSISCPPYVAGSGDLREQTLKAVKEFNLHMFFVYFCIILQTAFRVFCPLMHMHGCLLKLK